MLKHAALVAVLLHLRKKDTPFAVIDSHAGRGVYDLLSAEANKTGEAEFGIVRVLAETGLPDPLPLYCEIVRGFGDARYPGSPLIAVKLLRSQDRLVAIEKHPEEFSALAATLAGIKNVRAVEGDYRAQMKKLLPPPERRGVVLIDPPYEADDEFIDTARVLIASWRRFATGIYLLWYPAKHRPSVDAVAGELLNAGIVSLLRLELDIGGAREGRGKDRGPPMTATGLIVVNAPYGLADQMNATLRSLVQLLGRGRDASSSVKVLAGEP